MNTAQKKIKELEGEREHVTEQYREEIQRLEADKRKILAENEQLAEQNRQLNERVNALTVKDAAAPSCPNEDGAILERLDSTGVHNLQVRVNAKFDDFNVLQQKS